jgi:hypothetical protein
MVEEYVQSWARGGLYAARRVAREAHRQYLDAELGVPDRVAYCRARARNWASSSVWEAARQNPVTAAQGHFAAATAVGFWQKAEEEDKGLITNALLHAGPPGRELRAQAGLLRDVVGNPFQPGAAKATRLTGDDSAVVKLAQDIYDERSFNRMPILADALKDAGCEDADILAHCRQKRKHVRGCWVVDLLLGKS